MTNQPTLHVVNVALGYVATAIMLILSIKVAF